MNCEDEKENAVSEGSTTAPSSRGGGLLISIVVPTCNRPDGLAQCLSRLAPGAQRGISLASPDELLATDSRAWRYEVIVANDGLRFSGDGPESSAWVRVVEGPRRGPAANRNAGARIARGQWLAFIDDDCLPDPGCILAYCEAIKKHPSVQVFEGKTYADRPQRDVMETSPINLTGGFLWSCNLLVRRSLFERMGGFDEDFPYAAMEDVDFRVRLRQLSEHVIFVQDAAVQHPWRLMSDFHEHLRRHRESVAIFERKHPDARLFTNWKIYALHQAKRHLIDFVRFFPRNPIRFAIAVAPMLSETARQVALLREKRADFGSGD